MNFSNSRFIPLLTVIIFLGCNQKKQKEVRSSKPNIILIFTDDQDYGDLGYYASPNVKIPNIDRMASVGMRFTSFYAAANYRVIRNNKWKLFVKRIPLGGLEETELYDLETDPSEKYERLKQHPKITNNLLKEA